jgi:hypothetical protein
MFGRFRKHGDEDRQDHQERVEIEQKKSDGAIPLLIRNNSRIQTMQKLVERFGSNATSGRYFAPSTSDVGEIASWCSENGLFVKKSDLGTVTVLDIMTDKDLRYK